MQGRSTPASGRKEWPRGEQSDGNDDTAKREGDGAGNGGAGDAQAGAPDCDAQAEDPDRPSGVDQEKVQNHVDQIHNQADRHGLFRVAGRTENGSEDHAGRAEEHRQIENPEIAGSHRAQALFDLHPAGDEVRQADRENREKAAGHQNSQDRLRRGFLCAFRILGTKRLGDIGQKADAER